MQVKFLGIAAHYWLMGLFRIVSLVVILGLFFAFFAFIPNAVIIGIILGAAFGCAVWFSAAVYEDTDTAMSDRESQVQRETQRKTGNSPWSRE